VKREFVILEIRAIRCVDELAVIVSRMISEHLTGGATAVLATDRLEEIPTDSFCISLERLCVCLPGKGINVF